MSSLSALSHIFFEFVFYNFIKGFLIDKLVLEQNFQSHPYTKIAFDFCFISHFYLSLHFRTLKRKCQEHFPTFAWCVVVPTWGRLCKNDNLIRKLPLGGEIHLYENCKKLSVYDVKYLIKLIIRLVR